MLTFIIPVRHPSGVADWPAAKAFMAKTLASIAAQTHPDWNCMIAAERGTDLPDLPDKVDVVWTDIPPTPLPDAETDQEGYFAAVREDKGARMLAALIAARPEGHVMFADYDDFVSRRLAAHSAAHPEANGWYVEHGFTYSGGLFAQMPTQRKFHKVCGTSHIVHSRLIEIPERAEDADPDYVSRMYGSHIYLADALAEAGTPLASLPFPGAVYRVGHPTSVSRSKTVQQRFLKLGSLLDPDRVRTLRLMTPARRAEFFGGAGF